MKHDPIIENRVLGALIAYGTHRKLEVQEAMLALDENCFFNAGRKELFLFIKNLFDKKKPFDDVTLLSLIPESLTPVFTEVLNDGYLTTNLISHDIKRLKAFKILRPSLTALKSLINFCTETNEPDDCLERLQNTIHEISNIHADTDKPYIETYEQVIDEILASSDSITEIHTNLSTWPPFPASSMITIAGRSGTGKTFFAIFLLEHLMQVTPDKQAIYFNLEMQKQQMISRHAGIMNNGNQSKSMRENITDALSGLMKRDVKLVTRPGITIEEIETIARTEALKKPLSVIVVDYIGLVKTKRRYEQRHIEQGEIAQRLAGLAIDLNCIVLCLLQVNRNHQNRQPGDKAPYPTDAAESTGAERSSSWWLGIDQPQVDSEDLQFKDLFIIKNRKNRGSTGYFTIYMHFKNGCFYEIDQKSVNLMIDKSGDKPMSRYAPKNWDKN